MKRKQDHPPAAAEYCGECGSGSSSGDRWLLHNVFEKPNYRRLCTHCVLNCFRGHFCPVCLDVFDPIDCPPPPKQRVECLNCPSISHLSCAANNSGGHPFQCPSCANPNFSFFTLGTDPEPNRRVKPDGHTPASNLDGSSRDSESLGRRVIDKDSAKALVAAARISAATMSKASHSARIDAENKIMEAALKRKQVKEALEKVAFLSLKEKERELKVPVNGGIGIAQEQKMKPRVSNSALENNNTQTRSPIPCQVAEGLRAAPVIGSMRPVKGANGLPTPSPASTWNQQNNHHC